MNDSKANYIKLLEEQVNYSKRVFRTLSVKTYQPPLDLPPLAERALTRLSDMEQTASVAEKRTS